jgi:hypothetical protein
MLGPGQVALGGGDSAGDAKAAIEQRQDQQGEQGRAGEPADHDDGKRPLHLRARPGGEQQRHQAEGSYRRGEQHRPQAAQRAVEHHLLDRLAFAQ